MQIVKMMLYEKYATIPAVIRPFLQGSMVKEVEIGRSNAHVYQLQKDGQCVYLKTLAVSEMATFARDVQILRWLQGRLPVPEVLAYTQAADYEYLILAEIAGQNCVEAMNTLDHGEIVTLLATGLRTIHALDIADCPFDERIDAKLENARYNVAHHLVDVDDFDLEHRGMVTGRAVLHRLESVRPTEDDLVFAHGDYCLPNIILQNGAVNGFIDLDRAGISDKYNDLAIASRSIRDNLGARYVSRFFAAYGLPQVDEEKIAYYRLMDELF